MTRATSFRGQPLLVLAGVLFAWFGVRVALWQPLAEEVHPLSGHAAKTRQQMRRVAFPGGAWPSGPTPRLPSTQPLVSAGSAWRAGPPGRTVLSRGAPVPSLRDLQPAAQFALAETGTGPVRLAVGHGLLLAAGLSQLELPPTLAAIVRGAEPVRAGVPAAAPQLLAGMRRTEPTFAGSRLSADAWLALRLDTTHSVASGRPSYGRSQAGGVMRYSLAPSSAHAAQAYLRASSAIGGALERDLVVGASARPLPRLPLRLAAEARLTETAAGIELRPAVIAVAEIGPVVLPRRTRAEAYVQGGYVGGRFATGFVDGLGRIERPVGRLGDAEIAAGAGVWGGTQKGAGRLDAGPTAVLAFRVGGTRGRIAADYRFRLAGNAEPRSGPALTLSAGF